MLKAMDKLMMAGLGAISMSQEKAENIFEEYVKRGEAARENKEGFVAEMINYAEKNRKEVEEMIGRQLNKTLTNLDLPTKEDLARLEKKIDKLLKQDK